MGGRWTNFCIFFGIFVLNLQENCYIVGADFVVTDTKTVKRIEIIKTSNSTSNLQAIPTVIHQGNNVFIKPKFVLGSPLAYDKQDKRTDNSISLTSKVTSAKSSTVIEKAGIPQLSIVLLPSTPPGIISTGAVSDISTHLTKILNQPRVPIPLPNLCQSMASPTNAVPISPYLPQLLNCPVLVEKPVRPVVIPEPPQLPPIILPKLPIQVTVQRPIIPIPNHRIIVSPLCPPMVRCIQTENDPSSVAGIFNDMYQKFRNMLTVSSETNSPTVVVGKHTFTSNLTVTYPTLCAQGIVAERVVPNIVTNDNIKVFMSPISPSQLPHLNYYRK